MAAILAIVISSGNVCFYFLLIAMDEQFLHILMPIQSSQAQGKIFHAMYTKPPWFLTKMKLVCKSTFPKFMREVQDSRFWLLSNTVC